MKPYAREIAVYVVLGALTAGGVHLVQQNHTLTQRNQSFVRGAAEPHAGLYVASYPTRTLDGAPVTLGALGQRQLVIFFRTTCPYCRASTPAWTTIAAQLADHPEVAVYGVALDSAPAARTYAAAHGLRFPVIARPDPRLVALYRVGGVPVVLILNEHARITYARLGVLAEPVAVDSVVAAARTMPAAPHFVARRQAPR